MQIIFNFIMEFIIHVISIVSIILGGIIIIEILMFGVDTLFEVVLSGSFFGNMIRKYQLDRIKKKSDKTKKQLLNE